MSLLKNRVLAGFFIGEVSPRQSHGILNDDELKLGLRALRNMLVSRNAELTIRPPMVDQGTLVHTGGDVTRSFQFRMPDGNFTILTFSALKLEQFVIGSEDTFTPITTLWTAEDVAVMDGAQHELDMIFTTPGKEPIIFQYADPNFTLSTVEIENPGANPTPWWTASDWPVSVIWMIGRFVMVSPRRLYGSNLADPLDWDLFTRTVDDELVVKSSSAFSYDAADDLDSGFHWLRGGTMAFGGSPAGTWMLSNYENALSATNPNIKNYSSVGTYKVPAADIDGGMAYFTNDGVTMRVFAVTPNGPMMLDMNTYSKHFFEDSKPKRMVFQRIPDTILWILREDGKLVSFCGDARRKAWSLHDTEGTIYDIWLGKSNTDEYLYMDIDRGNGRRVERFGDIDPLENDYFVDGLVEFSTNDSQSISSMTTGANGEGIYTIVAHGYAGSDTVRTVGLDDPYAYIVLLTADTFSLQRENKSLIEASQGYDFLVKEAVWELTYAQFANKELDVYLDGYHSVVTADASGKLVFLSPGSNIAIGYIYTGYFQPRSFIDIHGPFKAAVINVIPRLYKTKSILYGTSGLDNEENLIPVDDDSFSGSVSFGLKSGMDHECTFYMGGRRGPFILLTCIVDVEVGQY